MKWFGASWQSELCTKARQAAPPRGDCGYCKVAIGKQDRGVIDQEGPYHLSCFLALVIGQK